MKRRSTRKINLSCLILVLLLILPLVLGGCSQKPSEPAQNGSHPFASLKPEELVSAKLYLFPEEQTLSITDPALLSDLAALLNDLAIYEVDESAGDREGSLMEFTLTLADGTTRNVGCINPSLWVDGTGYQTESSSCEALASFGRSLAGGDALEEPGSGEQGSGIPDVGSPAGEGSYGSAESYFAAPGTALLAAKVMEVSGSSLLISETGPDAQPSSLISFGIQDVPVFLADGSLVPPEDIESGTAGPKAGDTLEIAFDGSIMESYPAQISASAVRITGSSASLVSFYLDVMTEWYEEDPALNDGTTQIGFDLSGVNTLSEAEKNALIYLMSSRCGKEPVTGTFEELCDAGYIDQENLYWEDGIFFAVKEDGTGTVPDGSSSKDAASNPSVPDAFAFSIHKWRSGLGAIGSSNCTAEYKDGTWHYTPGDIWIS